MRFSSLSEGKGGIFALFGLTVCQVFSIMKPQFKKINFSFDSSSICLNSPHIFLTIKRETKLKWFLTEKVFVSITIQQRFLFKNMNDHVF